MTQIKFKLFAHGSIRPLRTLLIFLMLCVSSLSACQQPKGTTMDNPNEVFLLRLGPRAMESFTHTETQPVAKFYIKAWRKQPLGQVTFEHGWHTIRLNSVIHILGEVDGRVPQYGIQAYDIDSGVSDAEFITHKEAYQRVTELVQYLQKQGWQRYIGFAHVRLSGKDAYRHALDGRWMADPRVSMTYEQWQALFNKGLGITYVFYADGVLIRVFIRKTITEQSDLSKVGSQLDYREWGQYMMRIEIQSAVDYARNGTQNRETGAYAKDWRGEWENKLKEYAAERAEEEQKLRAQGYQIDTTYQDPDFRPYFDAPQGTGK